MTALSARFASDNDWLKADDLHEKSRSIGSILKKLRTNRHLGLARVAAAIGVSAERLSAAEAGLRPLSPRVTVMLLGLLCRSEDAAAAGSLVLMMDQPAYDVYSRDGGARGDLVWRARLAS